jgi:hypothetical protein
MKIFRYILLVSLFTLPFACNDDDEEDALTKDGPFAISELAGSWEATQALFSNNTATADVVEDGGTVMMTVQSNGRFTLNIDPVDQNAYTVSGEMFWEKWEGSFYFSIVWDDYPDDWDSYGYDYNGTNLNIFGGPDTGEYDFDNDGNLESCSVDFIFDRT